MFALRTATALMLSLSLGFVPDHRALQPKATGEITQPATPIPLLVSEVSLPNAEPPPAPHLPDGDPGSPARPILKPAVASWDGSVEQITLLSGGLEVGSMNGELAKLASLTAKVSSDRLWEGSFQLPLNGLVTTPFGRLRSYEGSAAGPHLGIDVAGPPGAAVLASNTGTVVFAGQWDVRGNAVLLDHGQGIYTGYYHLAMPVVGTGQMVVKGEVIGAVGATGLATGPHVHWDMIVRGVHVSPLDWIDPGDVPATVGDWPMVDLPPEVLAAQTPHRLLAEDVEALSQRDVLVREVYHSMLGGRSDTLEDEVRLWVASDLSLDQLPSAIVKAGLPERTRSIRRIYQSLLGWDPAGDEDPALMSWVESDLTIEETQAGILRAGMSDRLVAIRRLYVQLLGWDPLGLDDAGLGVWAWSGMPLSEIHEALANSDEARARGSAATP